MNVPSEAPPRLHTQVTTEALDAAAIVAQVTDPAAGAVVEFRGIVRDHDHGRGVHRLEYEAHPGAEAVLRDVLAAVADRHAATIAVAAAHRHGPLEIGDDALVAAVATAHRADAFALIADLVDEIKARVPIWKHQWFSDGTDEWVNSP